MSQLTVVGVRDISVWKEADIYFIEKIKFCPKPNTTSWRHIGDTRVMVYSPWFPGIQLLVLVTIKCPTTIFRWWLTRELSCHCIVLYLANQSLTDFSSIGFASRMSLWLFTHTRFLVALRTENVGQGSYVGYVVSLWRIHGKCKFQIVPYLKG
jgi:hypothetical protein